MNAKDVEQCLFHKLFVLIITVVGKNKTDTLSCVLKKIRFKPDNKIRSRGL